MSAVVSASLPVVAAPTPIRVVVVDDSAVVRGLMARWLAEEPDLSVVASLCNGAEAVEWFAQGDADVVILDIEMPELDGLSALPLLLARKRDLVVLMASTLTRRNAEISLKALSLGAADYLAKPEARRGAGSMATYRRELIDKVRLVGHRRLRFARFRPLALRSPELARVVGIRALHGGNKQVAPFTLRPASQKVPRVLLVGASTGGPQALISLMPQLVTIADRAPILIVQHMPPTFTTIMAEHLARVSGRPAREAADHEPIVAGGIYLAPGGRHMRVACDSGRPVIRLDDGAPVNFCRPAVDPLFQSASDVWGARTLALILTGMGSDGTGGARAIVAAGGTILAQDEATSAVWGMPGSAANAGMCSAVLPLGEIAAEVRRLFVGGAA